MKKLFIFIALLLAAGVSSAQFFAPSVIYVNSAPTGACVATPPIQIVISTGVAYSCNNGTWASISGGGGSGTVSGQANGVIPLATGATVVGAQSHLDDGVTTAGTITSSENLTSTGTLKGSIADTGGQLINVATLGVTPDERFLTDCSTTASSATLTCPDGAFTAADNARTATVYAGTAGVWSLAYVSGGTISGGANNDWCYAVVADGGGSGAAGYFRTNSGTTIAVGALYVPIALGSGYTSAPTSVTLSSTFTDANGIAYPLAPHGASCSGTATVGTAILNYQPIATTMTVVNGTTATLGTTATNTVTGTALAAFGTDWTSTLQTGLNTLSALGGGTLYFPPTNGTGRYLIASGLTTPGSASLQSHFELKGAGGHWDTHYDNSSTVLQFPGGSNIDLRASSGLGKVTCNNFGSLEVDHLSLEDWGFDSTPFLFYGVCHPHVHDNTFWGSGPGNTTSQNTAVMLGDNVGDFFQGYSAVIDHNYFARIGLGMYAGGKGNGPIFSSNTFGNSCGGTFAVEYNGTTFGGGGGAQLGYRSGNLYEMVYYVYNTGFINAVGNQASGEQFWDSNALGIKMFYLSGASTGNGCIICSATSNSGWGYVDNTGTNPMFGFGVIGTAAGGNSANMQTLGGADALYIGDSGHLATGLIKDTSATPIIEETIPNVGDQKLSLINNGSSASYLSFTNSRQDAVPYRFDGPIKVAGNIETSLGGFKMDTCASGAYLLTAGGSCVVPGGVGGVVLVAATKAPTLDSSGGTITNIINFTTPNSGIVGYGNYTSGITAVGTAGQTCTLTSFNNSSTATATVALTGTNTIAAGTILVITSGGTGATAAPNSATSGAGTAVSCTGTATVVTALFGGQYRICGYLDFVVASTAGSYQITYSYTSDSHTFNNNGLTPSVTGTSQWANSAGSSSTNGTPCANFYVDGNSAVTARVFATSITGTPTIRYSASLEQLQ